MHLPKTTKQVCAFLELMGYYGKFIRNFAKIAKPLTLLTCQQAEFKWTTNPSQCFYNTQGISHPSTNITLSQSKEMLLVYTDASDDTCGAQLSQEHDEREFPIAFLSHTFTGTHWKWSTTEQEAYGVHYAVMKWNYYLQGA